MSNLFFLLLLCLGTAPGFLDCAVSFGVRDYAGSLTEDERREICGPVVSGPDWVFSQKNEDYGWGDQTHRALIVLALNNYGNLPENSEDVLLLQHQLEVELTKSLLRNATQAMLISDLALYIHALIITRKDPRNFYGLDLVEILRARIDNECSYTSTDNVNAFALLVLSDCKAIDERHLNKLMNLLSSQGEGRKYKESKALALHALACALDGKFPQYSSTVHSAAATLADGQLSDGSFGNVYTTALIMQALVAAQFEEWDESRAREFLSEKSAENKNMISTYYIERALKAREVRCFKGFYEVEPTTEDGLPTLEELKRRPKHRYITYTLRASERPEIYFTATVHVSKDMTFFDIMRMTAAEDDKFRFSWYLDKSGYPAVYSISGIPNNAEESLYWRLIEESRSGHRTETDKEEYTKSPMQLFPKEGSHMIYTYADAFKPAVELY